LNKKQKILTLVALVAFVALGAFHYLTVARLNFYLGESPYWLFMPVEREGSLPDIRMPWFMLGVIYAALFFLLQNKRGS
jgi:hypothetical protein